ncbi:MAG TPA: NAD(P) transhydrogenase subunit alpha [Gammaproteobacteria bacterium]|nr:NAD(P) transhydrogenase subunit alpha [Gammaproteobacteria bacterium]
MPIKIAVPTEITEGERRVAMVPDVTAKVVALGTEILVQRGAGKAMHIPDESYENVTFVDDAASLYGQADVVLKVQPPTVDEIDRMREGAVVIGFMAAHNRLDEVRHMRDRRITAFSVELIPRITRAQAMDALSSQASCSGYKCALMAATMLDRFFPMLTTAAGTIRPAKVLVVGAGVAGLQAIATARRLGAQVEAYDVRPAAKEQVQSLGAKFLELDVQAEAEGGYARELTEEERAQQQQMLADHVARADAVITTAAVPGRRAPQIISKAMVEGMKPGAVVIDLAAETGGNCEVTEAGKTVEHGNAVVHGPVNVPSMMAEHASEMYSKNLQNFLGLLIKEEKLELDWEDEILAKSVVTHDGEIRHEPTRELAEGDKK